MLISAILNCRQPTAYLENKMNDDDPNPYESPQSVSAESDNRRSNSALKTLGRFLLMGLIGFATFTSVGMLFVGLSYLQESSASVPWALSMGVLGAVLFSASEVFNCGAARIVGVLRRIVVTVVVSITAAFITAIVSQSVGWVQRTYDDDPGNRPLILWIFLFSFGMLLIKALLGVSPPNQKANSA
jgi:hypothetical protein